MSTLRISDAPLLPEVDGTEKIPTGGRGDYAISVDQIKGHIFQAIGKELVGLGNVDNTSDLDKPVSTAQQAALDLKADKTYVDTNLNLKADKTNVYTRSETTLALSQKADLVNGVIPSNQLPSYVDDVIEVTTSTLPVIGESGKIYVTTDTNRTWRWSGNQYVEISNGGVSDSTLKLQTPRKIANVDFDGTQDISIPHNNLKDRDVVGAHTTSAILDASGATQQEINNTLIHSVKSISELRTYKKRFAGQEVLVLSHTSDYFGGGSFYNDNSYVGVDNNGTVIIAENGDIWIRKDQREVTPEMFGALGVDATADTLATQKAFATSKSLAFYHNLTLNNTILIDKDYTSIKFHNAVINSTLTDKTLFDVNAEHCSINAVNSKVISPSGTWVGTQVTPSYAVFFVRKNYFKMKGLEVQNFYRFAVALSNSTYHEISGNIFDGGITEELTTELTSPFLSRGAVQYDPPAAISYPDPSLLLFGNKVRNDIQGFLAGNYGSTGAQGGIRVVNNDFYELKDHAVYYDGISSSGSVIIGNTAQDCRRPFVCGGVGTVLANNTCKSSKSNTFYEQFIALRDAKDCVVSNNTIIGYGASIGFFNLINSNLEITGNIVSGNRIKSTALGSLSSAIKFYQAGTISKNAVFGNTIEGYASRYAGVFAVVSDAGGGGSGNTFYGNTVTIKNLCYATQCYLAKSSVYDNTFFYEVNAATTETVDLIFGLYQTVSGNRFHAKTGFGANINIRAINLNNQGAAVIKGNTFDFSSPELLSKAYIVNAGSSIIKDNIYDPSQPLIGTLSIASGATTVEINNANILSSSFVDLQPLNAASAAASYFVTYANGKLTVTLSSAAASALSFKYNIS